MTETNAESSNSRGLFDDDESEESPAKSKILRKLDTSDVEDSPAPINANLLSAMRTAARQARCVDDVPAETSDEDEEDWDDHYNNNGFEDVEFGEFDDEDEFKD